MFESSIFLMFKCSRVQANAQMFKCLNISMFEFSNVLMLKFSKFITFQDCKVAMFLGYQKARRKNILEKEPIFRVTKKELEKFS